MPVIDWTPHLKISEQNGSSIDEYRLRAGKVEVRALGPDGDPYPGYSEWIPVTPEEIKLHFVKRTPVAKWLRETLTQKTQTRPTTQS